MQEKESTIEKKMRNDERFNDVIVNAHFYEPFKKDIHELFTVLGREEFWSDDPRDVIEFTQPAWAGVEHGDSAEKDKYTPEQEAAAKPILERMGLLGELPIDITKDYSQSVVVSGTTAADLRRFLLTSDARKQGANIGTEVWLDGQRPRMIPDGTNEEMLSSEGRFAGNDYSQNPWAETAKRLVEESQESIGRWQPGVESQFSEQDAVRISYLKVVDGDGTPNRIGLNIASVDGKPFQHEGKMLGVQKPPEGAPPRIVTDLHFNTEDGHDVIILNAPAVERIAGGERGVPRATTVSVTEEWLLRFPPEHGATVLYISGNPHTLRTAQDTWETIVAHGREDIKLEIAGTSEAKTIPIQTALGEVSKLIYNDVKRNYDLDK